MHFHNRAQWDIINLASAIDTTGEIQCHFKCQSRRNMYRRGTPLVRAIAPQSAYPKHCPLWDLGYHLCFNRRETEKNLKILTLRKLRLWFSPGCLAHVPKPVWKGYILSVKFNVSLVVNGFLGPVSMCVCVCVCVSSLHQQVPHQQAIPRHQ